MSSISQEAQGQAPRFPKRPLTLPVLASVKCIPLQELNTFGLHDLSDRNGVGIPYYDRADELIAIKRRTAIEAKEGSFWPTGKAPAAYGDWKLQEAAKAGWLILVEGESDCWALWHHKLPALGIPGSSSVKVLTREHLVGISKLYVHIEPDEGGRIFQENVLKRLAELSYAERVFTFRMPAPIKDPSELHVVDGAHFAERFKLALDAAEPQTPAHVHGPGCQAAKQKDGSPGSVPAGEGSEGPREPATIRLSEVKPQKVEWLWPGRVPLGKLTILDGDPSLGKSTMTLDLAARLTRGSPMPLQDQATTPAAPVILMGSEDGLPDTIQPRLAVAGADLAKVIAFSGIRTSSGTICPLYLPLHVHEMHELVAASGAKLVVIDPLVVYLPETVNANSDQSVRTALLPLAEMAQATGAAVLVVRHLNKQPAKNALYRGGGSIGIVGAARSGLMVCKDAEDPDRRILGVTKSNLCKKPPSIAYEVVEQDGQPMIRWGEELACAVEEMLNAEPEGDAGAAEDAEEYLLARLSQGPVSCKELLDQAPCSERTLRRAKKRLKIKSAQVCANDEHPAYFAWMLPKSA